MTSDATAMTSPLKFASSQGVTRQEDLGLLQGRGRYTDDVNLPDQLYGYVLRSPYAHAAINSIGTDDARAAAGVQAVYTAADMDGAGYNPFPKVLPLVNADGSEPNFPERYPLARDKLRHVGEPVAFVVAESLAQAVDAAELIELDVDILEAVTDPVAALEDGAPQLHEAGNLSLDWQNGDAAAVDAAFDQAAHVTRVHVRVNRLAGITMEPRGAVASYDAATERFTVHLGCQGVWAMRETLARALMNVEPEQIRILARNIGGSFGMKAQAYPEMILTLHAARDLGRPVKWIEDRSGSFLSDYMGRDYAVDAALALDLEGNFLAVKFEGHSNLGGFSTGLEPMMHTANIEKNGVSLYRTPLVHVHTRCVMTNTVPTGPYRGAGRPEGNYVMERLIDAAARETGRDAVELRRQNLIPADAVPYTAASGLTYDSGNFPAVLDKALELADWAGFEARRAESTGRGLLRGRGITCYLEVTGPPGLEMGGIRFGEDGRVKIVTGTSDQGQGHATAFGQVLEDLLAVPLNLIDLEQGDSDEILQGGGTGGSKSLMSTGKALVEASAEVVAKGKLWAGHTLEAAVEDIEFDAGQFRVAGTDKAVGLLDLARQVAETADVPDGLADTLDVNISAETPPFAYPNGCHVCEVEIDPETGRASIARYTAVDDFGNIINPVIVDGQVHGGVAQGISQILMEDAVFDADGQLVAGSFMDYAMPRADDMPSFEVDYLPSPATTNPLGVKGCGEAGVSGALGSVMGAILDALSPHGVTDLPMPATPERIWQAINEADQSG